MRGATPSGCRLRRSTLMGGFSSSAEQPSMSSGTSALCATRFQWRSTASAGKGSWPFSTRSMARRAEAMAGSSSERWRYMGAKPAATSSALRSRSGTSSRSARRSTISRLGAARPVST
ncbi:hypothetical protein D9M69_572280 [compost metagenome]